MRRIFDRIVVIDVESTCWRGFPPKGEVSDIIEVGLCTVSVDALTRQEKRSYLVRPVRSVVGPFCTSLTTLTPGHVKNAPSLRSVCEELQSHYLTDRRVWASWGDYDRKQFTANCNDLGVPYPFGRSHINIRTLYTLTRGYDEEPILTKAIQQMGIPFEGTHHRGDDDAWAAAAILIELLKNARNGLG